MRRSSLLGILSTTEVRISIHHAFAKRTLTVTGFREVLMLSLAEEIFLLSLLDKKESIRIPSSMSLPFVLTGAVLAELALSDYVKVEERRLVSCVDPEQVTNEPMHYAIEKISRSEKPKKLDNWIYLLSAKGKRISKHIYDSLLEKGILVEKDKKFLWAPPPGEDTPEQLPAKYLLKREIRDALFGSTSLSERTLARIEFMEAGNMLDHLFTKDEIVAARKKVKIMRSSSQLSPNYLDLINQVKEAIDYAITTAITA